MPEDGGPPTVNEQQYGPPTDQLQCPYGHKGWVFLRYGRELVCGRCGTRLVNFPGVALG